MASKTARGGYQVLIERFEMDANAPMGVQGFSVRDVDEAAMACQLTSAGVLTEAVDEEAGLWLVALAPDNARTLKQDGWLELVNGPYVITAEWV